MPANAVAMGKAYVVVGARTGPLFKALGNAEKRIARFGAKVGQIAGGFAKLGTAIALPFVAASRVGLEFEKQMSEVRAVTGATVEEFQRLEKTARDLGASTSFTASEVGSAMAQLGRAGFEANEIIAAIPTTLALARASGLGMGEVAEIVADVGRAFEVSAGEIVTVADAITFTANNATTNISQMGEALKFVGASANAAGQNLTTITGALGILANQAIKGSQAGTSLNTILVKLAEVKVQDRLADLKVEIKDASGEMRDMTGILGDLGKRLENVGQVERLGILFELFGKRGLAAAQILTKMNAEWSEFTQRTKAATGVTQTTADIMEGRFNKALNQAKSAFEGLLITISKQVQPTFTAWLKTLTDTFNQIAIFTKENKDLVITLAEVGAAAIALAGAFGTLAVAAKSASFAIGLASGLGGAVAATGTGLAALGTIAKATAFTFAASVAPSVGSAALAFQGLSISTLAASSGLLKLKALVAVGIIAPFAAAATIIGSVVAITWKLWNLWSDNKAIIKVQNDIDKLNIIMREQKDALDDLDKLDEILGNKLDAEGAVADVDARIQRLKDLGKTEKEVTDQLLKDREILARQSSADLQGSALGGNQRDEMQRRSKLLLGATQLALDENKAATIKSEKEKAKEILDIRLDLIERLKKLQSDFEGKVRDRGAAEASAADAEAFKKRLGIDPEQVAKDLDQVIARGRVNLARLKAEADDAFAQAGEAATRDNVRAAQEAVAAYNMEAKGLDVLAARRRQAAQALTAIAQEEKDRATKTIGEAVALQQKIIDSGNVNPFIEGATSQFDGLTEAAKDALTGILEEIQRLREAFADGLIDEATFRRDLAGLREQADDAFAARRGGAGGAGTTRRETGTFGTFSAREAAGSLGPATLAVAKEQLGALRELVRLGKKNSGTAAYTG